MLAPPIPPPIVYPVPPLIETVRPAERRPAWRLFPPWLVSLVLHMNVLILLGLWQATREVVPHIGDVELSFSENPGDELLSLESAESPENNARPVASEVSIVAPIAAMTEKASNTPEIVLEQKATKTAAGSPLPVAAGSDGADLLGTPSGDPNAVRTSIFGLQGEGRRFVYVFDRSASMTSVFQTTRRGSRPIRFTLLEAAKQELFSSLEQLDQRHQFHLIFYNHETNILYGHRASRRLLTANAMTKARAASFIYQLTGEGETYHKPAIEMALRLRPEVIFLLTDGEEKDDPTEEEIEFLTKMNLGRTSINVIQICQTPRPDSSLIRLAKENRGQHRFLDLDQLYEAMRGKIAGVE